MFLLNSLICILLTLNIKHIDARNDTAIRDTFTNNIRNSIMSQLDKAFTNFTVPGSSTTKTKNGNNIQFKERQLSNNNIIVQPMAKSLKPFQTKTIKTQNTQIQPVNTAQLISSPSMTSFQPLQFVSSINTKIQLPQFKPRYQIIEQIPPHVIINQEQHTTINPFQINNSQQNKNIKNFQLVNPPSKTNTNIETPKHFPFHCQSQQIQTYSSSNPMLTIDSQQPSQTNSVIFNPLSIVTTSTTPALNQFNIQKQMIIPQNTVKTISKPIKQQLISEQQKQILQLIKVLQGINPTTNSMQNNKITQNPQNQIVSPILSNVNVEIIKPKVETMIPQIIPTNIKILPPPSSLNLFVPPYNSNINNLNTNSNIINGANVNQISNFKNSTQPTNNSPISPPPGTIPFLSLVANQPQNHTNQTIHIQNNQNKNNVQDISFLLSSLSNPNNLQSQPLTFQNQLKRQIQLTSSQQNQQKPFILPDQILSILNITKQLPSKEIIKKSEQYFNKATKTFEQCQSASRNSSSLQMRLSLNKCQLQYQNSKAIKEFIEQKYQQYLKQNVSSNSTTSNQSKNHIVDLSNNNNISPLLVSSLTNPPLINQQILMASKSSTNSQTPQVGGFLTSLGFRNSN